MRWLLVERQAGVMQPIPDALVTDSSGLLDGKVTQIVCGKIEFVPDTLNRPSGKTDFALVEQSFILKRLQYPGGIYSLLEVDLENLAVGVGQTQTRAWQRIDGGQLEVIPTHYCNSIEGGGGAPDWLCCPCE